MHPPRGAAVCPLTVQQRVAVHVAGMQAKMCSVVANMCVHGTDTIACLCLDCSGNDFSTLYAPLIRDGRMEKYYCECIAPEK
jgi:hypothetical protein